MDKDLLREKITEKRRGEWEALAIGIIGLVLVLVTLFSFFNFRGYGFSFPSFARDGRAILTVILFFLGLALMFLGAIIGMVYSHQRSKLLKQLGLPE